jgi:hypothetical protein
LPRRTLPAMPTRPALHWHPDRSPDGRELVAT